MSRSLDHGHQGALVGREGRLVESCGRGDVVALLNGAMGHLHQEHSAHGAILEAASVLRRQVVPQPAERTADDGKERLLAWQVRKVLDYIDRQITGRVRVADLCAL